MKKQLLLILMTLLPMVAWADETGTCGVKLTWTYYESTHSLVLTGSGAMDNWGGSQAPWFKFHNDILSVNLPEGLTSIGDYAFRQCSSLTSVTIPNSVTYIGDTAFQGCSAMSSITIPDNVTKICWGAFYGCKSLTSIILPASLKSISGSAFAYCSSLTSIYFGDNIETVGGSVFEGCSNLTSVYINNLESWCKIQFSSTDSNPLFYGGHLFINGEEVKELVFPNSITSIGSYTFCGSGITTLTIPNSVTTIGNGAFRSCSGLTEISIGNNITKINQATFSGCTNLKSLTLGGRITIIDELNFESCKELTTVYCYAENPPSLGNNVFSESYIEYATLYVPTQSVDKYRNQSKWGKFKYIFPIENIYGEKCAKPTISYNNGKLTFKSTTDDARFVTTIKDNDIKSYEGNEVNLSLTYTIEVCAKSYGYLDSDVAVATLCWMDKEPTTEGITDNIANLSAQAVLIQSEGGLLTVQGLDDGTEVSVYGVNGTEASAAVSHNGQAQVNTHLSPGSVAIVKIGEKSVKVVIK